MSEENAQYHHGNLSEALVLQAIKLLEQEGLASLTLRRIAKETGVSQAAPYSHFKDRKALFTAVANEGFNRFEQRMSVEAQADANFLVGLGRGYIYFALENPALFKLMFSGELSQILESSAVDQPTGESYQLLLTAIEKNPLEKFGKENPQLDSAYAWGLVHGIASLILANQFQPALYGYDHVEDFVTDMLEKFLGH